MTDRKIVIEIQSSGIRWSTIYLYSNGEKERIGSDSFEKISDAFQTKFRWSFFRKTNRFNGEKVYLVLNLVDPHSSVLATCLGISRFRLFVLSAEKGFYHLGDLSKADVRQFVSKLKDVKESRHQ